MSGCVIRMSITNWVGILKRCCMISFREKSKLTFMIVENTDNQVTRFVQGYVDNEANLNEKSSCKKTCSDYTLTQNYMCFNGSYCSHASVEEQNEHKCLGTVLNCTFIHSHVNICPAVRIFINIFWQQNSAIHAFFQIIVNKLLPSLQSNGGNTEIVCSSSLFCSTSSDCECFNLCH